MVVHSGLKVRTRVPKLAMITPCSPEPSMKACSSAESAEGLRTANPPISTVSGSMGAG